MKEVMRLPRKQMSSSCSQKSLKSMQCTSVFDCYQMVLNAAKGDNKPLPALK